MIGYFVHGKATVPRHGIYNYHMTGNGLFVQSDGRFIRAQVPVAWAKVRGLEPVEPMMTLVHGKVPLALFNLALNACLAEPDRERYLAFTWEDGYHLWQPEQTVTESGVEYQTLDNVVLDLHSHGNMRPFFSATDNRDEQGFRLYGVVGRLRGVPGIRLRVGVYGYFQEVHFEDVFDGPCPIAEDDDV